MIAQKKLLRSPIVDGMFYPTEKAGVLSYMKNIGLERGKGGLAQAIVAPHGAWELSGSLAGAAFAAAAGRTGRKSPSRVVIMGPIHDIHEKGIILSNSDLFQTPLGDLPVDQEATTWIESYSSLFDVNDIPHLQEHSIEVLLPFVKHCFPYASIVPILIGEVKEKHITTLAHALRAVFGTIMDDTLIVVSFNLVAQAGKAAAKKMANECLKLVKNDQREELCKAIDDGRITSCGGALLTALIKSSLVDSAKLCLASDELLSAQSEEGKIMYYSAFSFV